MAQQAERGLVVPTREPDLDNANVGNGYVSINTNVNLSRYIKQVYLFFYAVFPKSFRCH